MQISYDGTDYCGWQRQAEHKHASPKPSIQQTLEEAAREIFDEPIRMSASGRTDAGVHALAQEIHFDTERRLPGDLAWAFRGRLPSSIVVRRTWVAPPEFHATLSAEKKTYRYLIWNHRRASALMDRFTWWQRQEFDIEALNRFAPFLAKEQDFKSFQSTGTPVQTTVREIYSAVWARRTPTLVEFRVTGSGFLKQMVRNIVGTQIQLYGRGQAPETLRDILEARDRRAAGPTAPPQGLFLHRVYYPRTLDNECRQI